MNVPKLPNVVQKLGSRKKIVIPAVLVLVLAGGIGVYSWNRQKAGRAMAAQMSQVESTTVTKQNLVDSISVTGTIASADARDVSAIASNVKVKTVNYKVGDYVNEGDVVAVLDSSELERKLKEAQNSQALSEYNENKSIETASESYTQAVEDGTDDYNKAVKNESQAKEDLQDAEDDLSSAASTLKKREKSLSAAKEALNAATEPTEPTAPNAADYEGGEESEEYKAAKAEYDTAYATYQTDLANYQALQQAVNDAQASYTEAHQAYTAAADAEEKASDTYETASDNLTDASKNNDRNISNAADSLEKAQKEKEYSNSSSAQSIDDYKEQIEACTVTAPISGVITAMEVSEGDTYLGEGKTLFSIANNQSFIVSASVDEYEVSSISKDMTAAVIVEALGDEELPAKVSYVAPTATASTNGSSTGSATYELEIALDEENSDLRIGMTAKASIVKNAVYDVLTVPYDCVTTDEDGNSTITIEKDGEKIQVPVTTGMQSDYYVEVSGDDIEEGTTVYYNTPMVNNPDTGNLSSDGSESGVTFDMGGGDRGGGPGGGGAPGGGPGGF